MFFIHLPGLVSGVLISSTSGISVPETGGGGYISATVWHEIFANSADSPSPLGLFIRETCNPAKKKIPQNLLHVFRFLNFG